MRSPESLTPNLRFSIDSHRSPIIVASPAARPMIAAPTRDRRISSAATPAAAAAAPIRPPKKPDHVLLGEYRGQSLGPFKALPTAKAQMSAAQVVASSITVQPAPCHDAPGQS